MSQFKSHNYDSIHDLKYEALKHAIEIMKESARGGLPVKPEKIEAVYNKIVELLKDVDKEE